MSSSSHEYEAVYDILAQDIPATCLEEPDFLRNRLRVRDNGPRNDKEKILLQDGYTLHLLAASEDGKVTGAIYGHLISGIGIENRGVGFVTYVAVERSQRRSGIGALLLSELRRRLEHDAVEATRKPLVGMTYEIEFGNRKEIKAYLHKQGGFPLDITYYQPPVRRNTSAERIQLWLQPFDPPIYTAEQARHTTYPAAFVVSMVTNLLAMEYVGPDLNGLDPNSVSYTEFHKSIGARAQIGFAV